MNAVFEIAITERDAAMAFQTGYEDCETGEWVEQYSEEEGNRIWESLKGKNFFHAVIRHSECVLSVETGPFLPEGQRKAYNDLMSYISECMGYRLFNDYPEADTPKSAPAAIGQA